MATGTSSILLHPSFFLKALGSIIQSHIMDDLENSSFKNLNFCIIWLVVQIQQLIVLKILITEKLFIPLYFSFNSFLSFLYNLEYRIKKKTEYKKLHNFNKYLLLKWMQVILLIMECKININNN